MTGSDTAHDAHADHSVAASLVLLVLVGIFSYAFMKLADLSFNASVGLVAVVMALWGLVSIWVIFRD
jgi:hypothetical protein